MQVKETQAVAELNEDYIILYLFYALERTIVKVSISLENGAVNKSKL